MEVNSVNGIKLMIKPETYLFVINELHSANDTYLTNLWKDFLLISQVPKEKWLDTTLLESSDTLAMYLTGFKSTEIATIRGISRQSSANKLTIETEKLKNEQLISSESELTEDHTNNRSLLQKLMVKYFVYVCSKEKDILIMDNILATKYRTKRSKYVAFIKLGGLAETFAIDQMDDRFAKLTGEEAIESIFELFRLGKTNMEVSEAKEIGLDQVYYYRKKYNRFENSKIKA